MLFAKSQQHRHQQPAIENNNNNNGKQLIILIHIRLMAEIHNNSTQSSILYELYYTVQYVSVASGDGGNWFTLFEAFLGNGIAFTQHALVTMHVSVFVLCIL